MTTPHFFGYGSLVNLRTHGYRPGRVAQLDGYRRIWRSTAREVAILSVHQAGQDQIDGLVAPVPNQNWTALDRREAAYDRHDISDRVTLGIGDVQVYVVPPATTSAGDRPILLSYLDVVVQGFLQLFGEAGVTRFFDTTDGWDRPILDDRARPHYPRAQRLRPSETTLVDHHITRLRLARVPA